VAAVLVPGEAPVFRIEAVRIKLAQREGELVARFVVQGALVAFDTQDVFSALVGDLFGNGALGAHGVDGHHGTLEVRMASSSGIAVGSIAWKTREKVLSQGMPLGSLSHLRSQVSCSSANSSIIS